MNIILFLSSIIGIFALTSKQRIPIVNKPFIALVSDFYRLIGY